MLMPQAVAPPGNVRSFLSASTARGHQLGVTFAAFFFDGSKNAVIRFIPCFFGVALTMLEFSYAFAAWLKSANFTEYTGYMLSLSAPTLPGDCSKT